MPLAPVILAAVAVLAGRHVPVTCTSTASFSHAGIVEPAGLYSHATDEIVLEPRWCRGLNDYAAGIDSPDSDNAVLLLAHESQHASLRPHWRDETIAECRAWSMLPITGWLLGASEARADLLLTADLPYHLANRSHAGYGQTPCP